MHEASVKRCWNYDNRRGLVRFLVELEVIFLGTYDFTLTSETDLFESD